MLILHIMESPTDTAKDVPNVAVKIKILKHASLVVNLRTLRNKYNAGNRPRKDTMEDLQDECLGELVKNGNMSAFIKQVPSKVNESEDLTPYKMSIAEYTSALCRKNYDLPKKQRELLLSKSNLGEDIMKYLEEDNENQFQMIDLVVNAYNISIVQFLLILIKTPM